MDFSPISLNLPFGSKLVAMRPTDGRRNNEEEGKDKNTFNPASGPRITESTIKVDKARAREETNNRLCGEVIDDMRRSAKSKPQKRKGIKTSREKPITKKVAKFIGRAARDKCGSFYSGYFQKPKHFYGNFSHMLFRPSEGYEGSFFHKLSGEKIIFEDCALRSNKMKKAFLIEPNFREADLSRSLLQGSSFYKPRFNGATLSEANFSGSLFVDPDFGETTYWTGPKFHGTDFSKAIFIGGNFNRSIDRESQSPNLQGAFYYRTNITLDPNSHGMIDIRTAPKGSVPLAGKRIRSSLLNYFLREKIFSKFNFTDVIWKLDKGDSYNFSRLNFNNPNVLEVFRAVIKSDPRKVNLTGARNFPSRALPLINSDPDTYTGSFHIFNENNRPDHTTQGRIRYSGVK